VTRVVVAGTAFGRIYLDAVSAAPDFTLAGILARGSDYSRDCAARYDVPLFESVEEVPDDVDVACVVVRSGALGGPGTELAQAFLRRGMHVLQEHPVHADEIGATLRVARAGGAAYAVNTLYPNIRPVRRFLAAVEVLRSRQRLDFIDAACNSQVAYPLLDVLGRMTAGLRPWSFGDAHGADRQPFLSLHAEVGGVPVTLRVQNQVHPGDPDNHSYLLHRISVGCDGGVLALADTHGPVLWNPRLHSPRDETGRLVMAGRGTERLDVPSTVVLGDEPPGTYHQVFADLWPDAVAESLRALRGAAAEPNRRMAEGQWALGVSRMWSDLTARIGMPELVESPEPEPIPLADLLAAKDAA
jgi:pyochelin biosynthetic protein PchG